MNRSLLALSPLVVALLAACGGGVPAVSADRTSGQSGLMAGTFAGANACNPKSHDRPFVIEWDGTDMSTFESVAANNTVFVSYHGCELKVIDSCRNDSQPGAYGAYRPVDWTSGSVEKIDVRNEGELYAKLPLGAATLGSRVKAGESFVMEYFVAGVSTSTRAEIRRGEIAARPGCKDVTHYVYGYNLGAFALGSHKAIAGSASVGVGSVGGGGATVSERTAAKKGGSLSACRSDSAKEVLGCKTPIRLTLRAIADGQGTDAIAAAAPETPDAKNLAGKIQRERTDASAAEGHANEALEKQKVGDFAGSLVELDAFDKLEPNASNQSTNPASKWSFSRAAALMKTGKCEAGRDLYKRASEKIGTPVTLLDMTASDQVVNMCVGNNGITPSEQLRRAMKGLEHGRHPVPGTTPPLKLCQDAYADVKRLEGQVKPQGETELLRFPDTVWEYAPGCFANAKDCATGLAIYKERNPRRNTTDARNKSDFEHKFPACAGK